MHHFKGSDGTDFNFNSDFSGDVLITTSQGERSEVSGRDIVELVLYKYLAGRIIDMIDELVHGQLLLGWMRNKEE